MPKLRMGVVSCGAIAQAHLRGISACEEPELEQDGEVLVDGGPDPFVEQMSEFVRAVQEGREPGNSGGDVLASLAVIDAAYQSVEEGRSVEMGLGPEDRWILK